MKITNLLFLCGLLLMTWSCGDDDTDIPNEEELITTMIYTLTSSAGDVVSLSFVDIDGDGGDDPIVSGGTLQANETYVGAISFLNESETPTEDITEEVAEEDLEHQVFYTSSVAGLSVSYTDEDSEGNPLGLATTLTTGDAGSGTLTIILRHEPNKSADGVSEGSIENAGGETDIEVDFNVVVQ